MKRFLFLSCVFALYAFVGNAQITITSADLPVVNSMIIFATDTVTAVSPGDTGTDQTWDLRNLIPSRIDTMLYEPTSGHPNCQAYPEANIVYNALTTVDETGMEPVYNYWYVKHDDSGMRFVGAEHNFILAGIYSYTMHWKYNPLYLHVPLPLNYGDNLVQNAAEEGYTSIKYQGVMVDSMKIINDNTITTTVDASGTMITPFNTFSVLRLKEVKVTHHYQYIWTGSGWELDDESIDPAETEYRWYANNYFEVGSCSENGKSVGFTFFKSSTLVGMEEPSKLTEISIYPNPTSGWITIHCDEKPLRLKVRDIQGSIVSEGENINCMDLSCLPPGLYMLEIYSKSGVSVNKIIKN